MNDMNTQDAIRTIVLEAVKDNREMFSQGHYVGKFYPADDCDGDRLVAKLFDDADVACYEASNLLHLTTLEPLIRVPRLKCTLDLGPSVKRRYGVIMERLHGTPLSQLSNDQREEYHDDILRMARTLSAYGVERPDLKPSDVICVPQNRHAYLIDVHWLHYGSVVSEQDILKTLWT